MKHLLSAADLSLAEALAILDTAEAMAETQSRQMKKLPTLRGRSVVNLFFEDSTRTRISFEAAAKRLSADVINFSAKGSSVSKGESLKDTAQTLNAMGIDAVVIRHHASGAPHRLAETDWIDVPVINAGTGRTSTRPRHCSTRSPCDASCAAPRTARRPPTAPLSQGRRWRSWGTSSTRGWCDRTSTCCTPWEPR
jgi:aspartate carbamoyltransferase (EC 2.1.3.2)